MSAPSSPAPDASPTAPSTPSSGSRPLSSDAAAPPASPRQIVPPTRAAARLMVLASLAMAFLAVFALALGASASRTARAWQTELADQASLMLPAETTAETLARAQHILETTPGLTARALGPPELRALLRPWLGTDLAQEDLPLPPLFALTLEPDATLDSLRLRLAAELPQARLEDHARWRAPLHGATGRLERLGWISAGLTALALAAVTALAAQATLAAQAPAIAVLRLVGARNAWIARAFVGRIALYAGLGAGLGAALAALALASLPPPEPGLPGLRPQGLAWALPLMVPLFSLATAWAAAHLSARAHLKGQP